MLSRLALAVVRFYRRHLSARKGYRCAWGVHTGISTCSTRGVRIFRRASFGKALALLRRQFDRCALSAQALRDAADVRCAPEEGRYLGSMRMMSQRGVVDCDCGPGPGPGCDDCFRGCELPDFKGCNPCGDFDKGAGSRGALRGCMSAAADAVWCCDPGPSRQSGCERDCSRSLRCERCTPDCGGRSGASGETAADRARRREDERARRREERRQVAAQRKDPGSARKASAGRDSGGLSDGADFGDD